MEYAGRFPYVIEFDRTGDEDLDYIYTDGQNQHCVRGQTPDDEKGAHIPNEILIYPPEHRGASQGSTLRQRDRETQKALQDKLEKGTLYVSALPADPYRDITPTGEYTLRRSKGSIPCMQGWQVPTDAVIHSYAPDGKWLGMMTEERFLYLARKWEEYWADPRKHERGGGDIKWRPLEREIADLLRRYTPGARKSDGTKVDMQNHWAVRNPLRKALMRGYGVTMEAFASPLNCLMGEDAPEWYCSAHKRDVVFGARYDAYAQWTGRQSLYMNPEYTKEEIRRALRWVIAASQLEDPFCAILVIPRYLMATYMDLLSHRNVHLVAKAERDTFSFMAPTHWEVGDVDPQGKNTAKWQVMFVEVANPEGRALYKSQHAEADVQHEICKSGAQLVTREDPAFNWTAEPYTIPIPSELQRLRRAQRKTKNTWHQTPPADVRIVFATAPPDMEPSDLTARAPGRGRLIFTDGSKMQDEVGAGYVIPTKPWHHEHFTREDDLVFPGRTMKVAGPQTVNRAEMTAILAALQDVGNHTDCTIYTDSKVAIQGIAKWAANPTLVGKDKHGDILREIARLLAERRGNTRILKIMAHKGHPGNEAADRMAKRAVENEEGPGNERRGTCLALDPTVRALFLKGEALTNLKKQLRPEMRQWLAERERLKDKTHLQWTVDNPEKGTQIGDIDPKPSNAHWRAGRSKPKSIVKHIFRMRGNDYMCNHMQWVHATEAKKQEVNPFCPYGCKFRTGPRAGTPIPDTWIHTFLCTGSGAADMATTRHNAACRIIERAIKQGEKGRATLLRNYGRQDEAPEEETVPQWILPVHCRGPGPMADSPDFMIVEGIPRHAPRPTGPLANEFFEGDQRISCKLTIGEVKYTDDLKMPAAHERAASKYQGAPNRLVEKLRGAGWKVTGVFTVVVGHRACVSKSNREAFTGLGIRGKKAQDALQDKLADSAAEWARSIVNHTRKARKTLERKTTGAGPGGGEASE